MDKWFFIEVQTYRSVNKMGLELGAYVEERYHQTVVHKDCMQDIYADVRSKMVELEKKYPKCKPFKCEVYEYRDTWQEKMFDISVMPENRYNDNCVFCLRTKQVRKMNLETSLHI